MKKILLPPPCSLKLNFATIALVVVASVLFSNRLSAMLPDSPEKCSGYVLLKLTAKPDSLFPCTETFDRTLQNGFQVSTNNPNGLQLTNEHIFIENNATVFFDRNVTMEKCTIRAGTNAKIIIQGAYGLTTFDECLFTGCYAMWEGIEVSASAFVQLDDTEFWSAKSALFFKKNFNTYKTLITNCLFKSNNIGIEIGRWPNTTDVNTIFTPQQFHGNTFEGGGLISPLSGKKSFSGISLYRCGYAFIGTSGANTFKNLNIGIDSRHSSVGVMQADFSDMYEQDGWGGFGIISGIGYLGVQQCSFSDDAKRGICAQSTRNLFVVNNVFTGEGEYGIYSESAPPLGFAWIYGNDFTLNKSSEISAIYHQRSPSGGLTSISDNIYNLIYENDITVTDDHAKLNDISLIDVFSPSNGLNRFPIQKNTITVNNLSTPIHGIYVRGSSSKLQILENTIDYPGSPAPSEIVGSLGIAAENVFGGSNQIKQNAVASTFWTTAAPEEKTSYIKCGIHLYNSPAFQVCSNEVDATYRAFHFAGNLNYCDFAANSIGRHFHGLHCVKWLDGIHTDLGPQDWHENVWSTSTGDYNGHAARYEDDEEAPFIFRVDTDFPGHMPPSINISNWFFDFPTDSSSSRCLSATFPEPEITEADEEVMDETYPVESAAGQWDLERELLMKLLTYPELMPENSPAETWYESKENTSPWLFAQAQKAFLDAFDFPENMQHDLDSLQNRYNTLWDYLLELDSMQRLNPYTIDETVLEDQESASEAFEELREAIDSTLADFAEFTAEGLDDAEAWNDDLPDTAVYEANLKAVYEIAVKAVRGDTLTEDDFDILRDIAGQCPLTGGSAVRIAPYRLPHAEAVTYLGEDQGKETCEAEERQQASESNISLEIRISPSPASEILTVILSQPVTGVWTVNDGIGRVCIEEKVLTSSEYFAVPLGNFPNGIYLLRVTDELNRTSVRKFSVIR